MLLYAGRWFPVIGYGTDRFTSTINVTVPAEMRVAGSGVVTKKTGWPRQVHIHIHFDQARVFPAQSSPAYSMRLR